jgi:predicted type IV restriction endonuclease
MNHLHYEFNASDGDVAEVALDRAANVLLMDSANYGNYSQGRDYRYFGGYSTKSPVRLAVPRAGHWHVVVDLGGGAGQVRASTRLLSKASA